MEAPLSILLHLGKLGGIFLLGLFEELVSGLDFGIGIVLNLLNGDGSFLTGGSNAGGLGLGSLLDGLGEGSYLAYLGL